jgi:plastocyanin
MIGWMLAPAAFAATVQMQLVGVDGRGIAGTVVALRNTDAARAIANPIDAVMDQADRQFVPHVLVVPTGSRVSFPNSDSVSHQVYSFSPPKRFQLPLYRGKAHPPVLFDQPGIVTVGCNIHDQMRAYVYVVDAQYFGRTTADGSFAVADVAPGEYRVQIWHPRARDLRPLVDERVRIDTAGMQLTLRVPMPLKLRPESQVPPNWDAY